MDPPLSVYMQPFTPCCRCDKLLLVENTPEDAHVFSQEANISMCVCEQVCV